VTNAHVYKKNKRVTEDMVRTYSEWHQQESDRTSVHRNHSTTTVLTSPSAASVWCSAHPGAARPSHETLHSSPSRPIHTNQSQSPWVSRSLHCY